MRRAIVNELRPWHVIPGATDGSGNSRDVALGREARPAIRPAADVGALNPQPLGTKLDADVDVDIIMRTPGNADGARWAKKDHSASVYQGKDAAGRLHDFRLISRVDLSSPFANPKLLALKSGYRLLVYQRGTDASSVYYNLKAPGADWSVARQLSAVPGMVNVPIGLVSIVGADIVQMPDTGEIILMITGITAGDTNRVILMRTSSIDTPQTDETGLYLPWRASPVRYQQITLSANIRGPALEVMPNNRIAMLVMGRNKALWRSYSDNRGATWAPWQTAGSYGADTVVGGGTLDSPGGVSMVRLRTGSLLAIAPALSMAFTSGTDWTQHNTPRLRLLVSDDGDQWTDMITASVASASVDQANETSTQADGLLADGATDGALAIGDDGLPHILACLHGDSNGTLSSSIYDDLALLTLAKADITSKDVGAKLTKGNANAINSAQAVLTCSDAFGDALWMPDFECFVLGKGSVGGPGATLNRIQVSDGAGTNHLNGGGELAPTWNGWKYLDVINDRGELFIVGVLEDTANANSVLMSCRCNAWSEQAVRMPDMTAPSSLLLGRVYAHGFDGHTAPDAQGGLFTPSITGVVGFDTALGGWRITGANSYYQATGIEAGGAASSAPLFAKGNVSPVSGGGANSNIAVVIERPNATPDHYAGVILQFSATAVRVVDEVDGTTLLGSVSGDFSDGCEFEVGFSQWDTLINVEVRETHPNIREDVHWQKVTLSATALGHTVGTNSLITVGNTTGSAATSTWRSFHYGIANVAATPVELDLNTDYAAGTPTLHEFADPIAWDDGLRHGTRPPLACAAAQYVRSGLKTFWQGAGGVDGDTWEAISSNQYNNGWLLQTPVGAIWRSQDDSADSYHVFDSALPAPDGTIGGRYLPTDFAAIKCNLPSLVVQFNNTNSWGSPSYAVAADVSGSAAVDLAYWRRTRNNDFFVEGNGNATIRLPDAAAPWTKNQFRSTTRQAWYLYSSALNKVFKVTGNDDRRLFLDGDATGAAVNGDYIALYTDRVSFALAVLGSSALGYRYMRLGCLHTVQSVAYAMPATEKYHQCGFVFSGPSYDLSRPHPSYGMVESADPNIATQKAQYGYVEDKQLGETPRVWQFAFNGMQDRPGRTAITAPPGAPSDASWQQWFDFRDATGWGEAIVCLMPEYSDTVADGLASAFGYKTNDLAPVRVRGAQSANMQAYYSCRSDALTRAIMDITSCEFREVL